MHLATIATFGAGHLPVLVRSEDGSDRYLWSEPGLPLGLELNAGYTTGTTSITPGDRLVLYTDGLIETRRTSLDTGMERLRAALGASMDRDPQQAAEWLAATVSCGMDDVAVIVVDVIEESSGGGSIGTPPVTSR